MNAQNNVENFDTTFSELPKLGLPKSCTELVHNDVCLFNSCIGLKTYPDYVNKEPVEFQNFGKDWTKQKTL